MCVDVLFACTGCGAESEPKKNRGWPVEHVSGLFVTITQQQTFTNNFAQRFPIVRVFCNWLTEIESLARPIVDDEREMVCSDGTADRRTERLDSLDRGAGSRMFQYDFKLRKSLVQDFQVGQKLDFSV